jgi:NitT/TauT family transport system substrate-binding protein
VLEAGYGTNILSQQASAAYPARPRSRFEGMPMKYSRTASIWLMAFIVTVICAQSGLTQETKRIRFAVTTPPHFLPIWVAKDIGLFSKQGLDVEVIFMRGGALITMGVISGELQLSGIGAESVVAARAEGGDVTLLACPLDLDLVYLISRPEIKTAAQLKGKATAVTRLGSTTHFYLRSAFKHLGMDADKDMTILQLGAGPEIAIALQHGQIAAAVLSYRNALSFLERGWPVLVNLTQTGFKYPPSCVAGSRAFVRKNPSTVDGFLKAYIEAIHIIKKDIDLTKRVYAKYYRESDPAVTDKVVRAYADLFKPIPNVPEEGIEVVVRDFASRRPLQKDMLKTSLYKDDGPLEKIIKEGWVNQLQR